MCAVTGARSGAKTALRGPAAWIVTNFMRTQDVGRSIRPFKSGLNSLDLKITYRMISLLVQIVRLTRPLEGERLHSPGAGSAARSPRQTPKHTPFHNLAREAALCVDEKHRKIHRRYYLICRNIGHVPILRLPMDSTPT